MITMMLMMTDYDTDDNTNNECSKHNDKYAG